MSNKLIFLIVAVLLVVTLGLAGGFFMMWNKLSALNTQANAAAIAQGGQGQTTMGTLFPLDTFIVNLADQERNRYLRVTMDLELAVATDAQKLTERLPQIRDRILMLLPSKRFADISSTEGKTALRDEIISKLNGLFPGNVITDIFFTEFVVQ
jgi:flagellar FliL protein